MLTPAELAANCRTSERTIARMVAQDYGGRLLSSVLRALL